MIPYEKAAIRPLAVAPMSGKEDEKPAKTPAVESVQFSFRDKGSVTLNIADFTSGQAMIDAAAEWAAKQ